MGGPAALQRPHFRLDEHLERLHRSARLAFTEIRRATVSFARYSAPLQPTACRRGTHPTDTDSRREVHQRNGPATEPQWANAYCSGRVQAAGLRQIGPASHHVFVSPARPGCARSDHSSQQLIEFDSAQDSGERGWHDDALMLDARGFVAETNATHIFIANRGLLATPQTVACPEGITRQCRARDRTSCRTPERSTRYLACGSLSERRSVLHWNDGRACFGH